MSSGADAAIRRWWGSVLDVQNLADSSAPHSLQGPFFTQAPHISAQIYGNALVKLYVRPHRGDMAADMLNKGDLEKLLSNPRSKEDKTAGRLAT